MKILIVSNNYHPLGTPRSFRWGAVAEHWAAQGHEVDVVCGWVPGAPRAETRNGVRVWRVGGMGEVLRSRLHRPGTPVPPPVRAAHGVARAAAAPSPVSVAARWVHDRTWRQLYWPDFACLWYRPALAAAARLLEQHGHEALVTVSHPFTGHLVGRRLKRRFPGVHWLVDIGDPFAFIEGTPPNNERLYRGLNYRAERGVLVDADEVAVTTAATAQRYAEVFPETAGRVHVIPPIVTVPSSRGAFFDDRADVLRLVFAGTLYRKLRSPEPLLRLFEHLRRTGAGPRLELHFIGALNGCQDLFEPYREQLGERIFLHGPLPREAAFRAMREADVLVNIGNESGYQLPSKVVEYVALARPVLHLSAVENDVSTDFFADYPAAFHLPAAEVDDAAQVGRLARFLERLPPVDPASAARLLAPYRVESVAAQYARLIGVEPAARRAAPALEHAGAHE